MSRPFDREVSSPRPFVRGTNRNPAGGQAVVLQRVWPGEPRKGVAPDPVAVPAERHGST